MEKEQKVPESLKTLADKLKENPDNTVIDIKLRFPAFVANVLKATAAVDNKTVNQWVRDVIEQSINTRTEHLSEMDLFKAEMTILKGYASDKEKAKSTGLYFEM